MYSSLSPTSLSSISLPYFTSHFFFVLPLQPIQPSLLPASHLPASRLRRGEPCGDYLQYIAHFFHLTVCMYMYAVHIYNSVLDSCMPMSGNPLLPEHYFWQQKIYHVLTSLFILYVVTLDTGAMRNVNCSLSNACVCLIAYIVVMTRSRVRFTPIELSKLWCPKKLVMWPMMMEMRVGRQVVRVNPSNLRSNCMRITTWPSSSDLLLQKEKPDILYAAVFKDALLMRAIGTSLQYVEKVTKIL